MNKINTSWGNVAEWYDELLESKSGSYQTEVILPNLSRVLDLKKTDTVLDVACGQGFFSRALSKFAGRMIGSDISKELIEIAKTHSPKSISFYVASADKLVFCQDNSVDKAFIVLALQNIENLYDTFNEVNRILKPGGRFCIVLNHPAFRIPKHSSWQWDEKVSAQYRRVDAYMSDMREKIDMNPSESKLRAKKFTISFHRPLQSYFKALSKTGFLVGRFEEWVSFKKSVSGYRANEENRIRKEIPMFAMIEAIKNS